MDDPWGAFIPVTDANPSPGDEWGQFRDVSAEASKPGAILGRMTQAMLDAEPDSKLSKARKIPNRILYGVNRWPGFGKVLGVAHDVAVMNAANRIKDDKANELDYTMVANFLASDRERQDQGTLQNIADIVSQVPGFVAEMALTGGAFTIGRAGAKKAIGEAAKSAIGRAAQYATTTTAGVAAQAAANPQLVAQQTVQRMMPEMQPVATPAGEIADVKIGDGDQLLSAIPKAYADTMIEIGSERGGKYLSAGAQAFFRRLPYGKATQDFLAGVAAKWVSKGHAPTMLDEALKLGRFDGIIGEELEEQAGNIARLATGLESPEQNTTGQLGIATAQAFTGNPEAWNTASGALRRIGEEMAAFAVPGVASAAVRQISPAQSAPPPTSQEPAPTGELYIPERDVRELRTQQIIDAQEEFRSGQEADKRGRREEKDAAYLDQYIRQRADDADYPVEQPSIGGIRQLPLSPDVDLESAPQQPEGYGDDLGYPPQPTSRRQELPPVDVSQKPEFGLTPEWQESPPDAERLLSVPGAEFYTARNGNRYVRMATDGLPLQKQIDARVAELNAMSVSQLNQEGSRYGLRGGVGKAQKIREIVEIEERQALGPPRTTTPEGQLITPQGPAPRQPVMLGLQNPISEIYDPKAPTTEPEATSVTEQAEEATEGQTYYVTPSTAKVIAEYAGLSDSDKPRARLNGNELTLKWGNGRRTTKNISVSNQPGIGTVPVKVASADGKHVDSLSVEGMEVSPAPEAPAEFDGPAYEMLDFDSYGRLEARKKMPVPDAHRMLKGREVVFRKLLECLS